MCASAASANGRCRSSSGAARCAFGMHQKACFCSGCSLSSQLHSCVYRLSSGLHLREQKRRGMKHLAQTTSPPPLEAAQMQAHGPFSSAQHYNHKTPDITTSDSSHQIQGDAPLSSPKRHGASPDMSPSGVSHIPQPLVTLSRKQV